AELGVDLPGGTLHRGRNFLALGPLQAEGVEDRQLLTGPHVLALLTRGGHYGTRIQFPAAAAPRGDEVACRRAVLLVAQWHARQRRAVLRHHDDAVRLCA